MVVIADLIWDAGNIAHIARHGVSQEEVEEVCAGESVVRHADKGRIMVIGPTAAGRLIAVVLHPKGNDSFYPVTARSADRRERRDYQTEKGGEQAA